MHPLKHTPASLKPKPQKQYKSTGHRLGPKGLAATALLAVGYDDKKTAQAVGINPRSVAALRKRKVQPGSDVDAVRRGIRDQMVMIADLAAGRITTEKLDESSALECMRIADMAIRNAGLAPPSVIETYTLGVHKYIKEKQGDGAVVSYKVGYGNSG